MQKISVKKNLIQVLSNIIDKIKGSTLSVTQQDWAYLRLMMDLASLEPKGNKRKFKITPLNQP